MERELDIRESVKVVTSNSFITSKGLDKLNLKERKLLYIAISQCRQADKGFFEFTITVREFARLMGIDSSNVYEEARIITNHLFSCQIEVIPKGKKEFETYSLFSKCRYNGEHIIFKLNQDMTDFLLNLHGSFTKPLLHDFLKMRSPYSMAIWHLFQREMKSQKPYADNIIEFDLTLAELRQVTGTENKLKQIVNFKERVLDKAIEDIKEMCFVDIKYDNIKTVRTVTGFHFTAKSQFYIAQENLSLHTQETIKRINEKRKEKNII